MADKNIEIRWENEERFEALLALMEDTVRRRARGLVEDLEQRTKLALMMNVPKGETLYLVKHVASSGVSYQAGGRSEGNVPGGGEYVAVVGVKHGHSMHPLYVHRGTGIYGPGGAPIRPKRDRAISVYIIAPDAPPSRQRRKRTDGQSRKAAMTFQKRGEARQFRRLVQGQPGQPFLYMSWREAQLYASRRLLTLGGEIIHPFR